MGNEGFMTGVTDEEVEGQWVNQRGQDLTGKLTNLWMPGDPNNGVGTLDPYQHVLIVIPYMYYEFFDEKPLDDVAGLLSYFYACQFLDV